jgi:PAP2 superfamily
MITPRQFYSRAIATSILTLATGLGGAGCSEDDPASTVGSGDDPSQAAQGSVKAPVVFKWNTFASDLVAANLDPGSQTYVLAVSHIAIHDAINAIKPKYRTYAFNGTAPPNASIAAAVAAAAHDTLVALVPQAQSTIDAEFNAAVGAIPNNSSKQSGLSTGQQAAAAILGRRAGDNLQGAIFAPYTPGPANVGVYQFVPPLNFSINAGWDDLPPFALGNSSQFRSTAPFDVASAPYAAGFNEVKAKGVATGSTRTAKESETAQFWYDAATKEWNVAARKGLTDVSADENRAARTLAVMNIALADAVIASLETKYFFNFWRPFTAIRAAATDNNNATTADPNWEPFCVTPPFPEYNSTHAATGGAAAEALKLELGDSHGFKVDSPTLQGLSRNYNKFSDAANEEAVSRIFCGIHFRQAMDEGLAQGRRVAGHVHNNFLLKR